jgi:putative ABC transport system permease protein
VWHSAWPDVIDRLKAAGRGVQGGVRVRVRNALVVAQVGIAVVLLAGAALLVRSLSNLQEVETGVETDRLMTARVWLPQPNDPASGPYFQHPQRVVLMRRILEGLGVSPEITEAGLTTALPATEDSGTSSFSLEGWTPDRQDLATATVISVTPGYFGALGMRLQSGRLLRDTDDVRTPRAAVINQSLARTYFGSDDPVGRRFRFVGRRGQVAANAPWITIVGVSNDVREDGLDAPVRPQIYQSLWQGSNLALALVARGRSSPPAPASIREGVQQADPDLPVYAIRSGAQLLSRQLAQRRFATVLINAFAAAALLLAALGLHGVIAYGVRQRTHEIGVRMALGATSARVMLLVAGQAFRVTAIGVAAGVAGALLLANVLRTLLFEVHATDPWTLGAVVMLIGGVVGVATLGAARRAARIEASVALRHD